MSGAGPEDATDLAWEQWGRRDPYFGVLSESRFRREQMTEDARRDFFRSGEIHVEFVLDYIRRFIDRSFAPRAVLDFGCGVGRTLMPLAALAAQATGLDVSPSMLQEARRNCDQRGLANVLLLVADDELSALSGDFDLIHSCIVFQHIPIARGRAIFARLLQRLRPAGIGALHVTYGRAQYADSYGVPPPESAPPQTAQTPAANVPAVAAQPERCDPEMQMNPYNLSEILFCVQQAGVLRLHMDFTDHGGELGVFLFFQKPAGTAGQPTP